MATLRELQEQIDDQHETIDQARALLEDVYTPEATRSELVDAVSQAIDLLAGEEEEDSDDDSGDDDEE